MVYPRRSIFLLLTVTTIFLLVFTLPVYSSFISLATTGRLRIDIDYTGTWYQEVFGYSREAENIRHFVLILPEDRSDGVDPDWVFTSLVPLEDSLTVRDDRQEYAWALDYVYEAPKGYFRGKFEPGTYEVATAFIAAPLSREDAGVGEDVVLWAGITGGGASTDYQTANIELGEITNLNFEITDNDGWACPWLYVFNGDNFERNTEILRNLRSQDLEGTEITPIGSVTPVDGFIVVRIAEERDEVTFLDAISLQIGDEIVTAQANGHNTVQLAAIDGSYLTLRQGEVMDLRFMVPESFAYGDPVSVIATGYYLPR